MLTKDKSAHQIQVWLSELPKIIDGIPQHLTENMTKQEVQSGETLVGTCSKYASGLYYLYCAYDKKKERFSNNLLEDQSDANLECLAPKICLFQKKAEILRQLFWLAIHAEFPDLSKRSTVGIRKGGVVVWVNGTYELIQSIEMYNARKKLEALLQQKRAKEMNGDLIP